MKNNEHDQPGAKSALDGALLQASPSTLDRTQSASDIRSALTTIEVDHLSKWYGDVVAVSDVTFAIGPGVTGLLGPNGAGKSSILKVLSGLLKPSSGSVRIFGTNVRSDTQLYRRIGVVPEQETIYPYLTGREFVRWNAAVHHLPDLDAATERAIQTSDLGDAASRRIGGYSKGMRQRIKIAAALVHDPDILILDEPLTGTDPVQRVHLIKLVHDLGASGKTVFVSSHVLHEVERLADRIIVIVDGKLAAVGDYRAIRDKIDEHARTIRVKATDNRTLASMLIGAPQVTAVRFEADQDALVIEADDVRAVYRMLPGLARDRGIRLFEIAALDDSLASVFAYVTKR